MNPKKSIEMSDGGACNLTHQCSNVNPLDIPFIDLFLMGEGVIFMVMTGSIFCCLSILQLKECGSVQYTM